MSERTHLIWECDHMRLVVYDADSGCWRHQMGNGILASRCEAGVYGVEAKVTTPHTLGRHERALRA